jgi:hypothetical protein
MILSGSEVLMRLSSVRCSGFSRVTTLPKWEERQIGLFACWQEGGTECARAAGPARDCPGCAPKAFGEAPGKEINKTLCRPEGPARRVRLVEFMPALQAWGLIFGPFTQALPERVRGAAWAITCQAFSPGNWLGRWVSGRSASWHQSGNQP